MTRSMSKTIDDLREELTQAQDEHRALLKKHRGLIRHYNKLVFAHQAVLEKVEREHAEKSNSAFPPASGEEHDE